MKIQQSTSPSFQAIKLSVANIKGIKPKQSIELYSLDKFDIDFAKKYLKDFNLVALYPNEKSYLDFDIWERFITGAFNKIGEQNVILATHKNKPCGIMSFSEKEQEIFLSYLAKWRPAANMDISYVGKVLMHHLFDTANKKLALNISCIASLCSPRQKSCKDFYAQLGFRRSANNSMNLFGADYAKKAKDLENFFEYKALETPTAVDSNKEFII